MSRRGKPRTGTAEIERIKRAESIRAEYNKPGIELLKKVHKTEPGIELLNLGRKKKKKMRPCPHCGGTGFVEVKGNDRQ